MPLDNYTSTTLRSSSIDSFSILVSQETNFGRLAVIGCHILEDSTSNKVNWIFHLLPVEQKIAKLQIIENRRQILIQQLQE